MKCRVFATATTLKDERGRRRIDTSELVRVYGQLRQSTDTNDTEMTAVDTPKNGSMDVNDTPETRHDSTEIIAMKDAQIDDLRKQLEKADAREDALIDEKTKLLDLLSAEKDEKRALMPPVEEKEKSPNWLLRNLFGAR